MTSTHSYLGEQIGNYRITKKLGEGGFGEVYLGEHIYLRSLAAIKFLLKTENQDAFLKEAQTLTHLKHPHIVRMLEFGINGEVPFLIMDYAPKGTLRRRHSEGTCLSLKSITYYVKQVADALQYAHNRKLIHRDVKPENILLGENDELLLSDFGLVVAAHSTRSQEIQKITGSWAYAAPEQFVGKAVPASDQYSLGIIAYEWLCGQRPFSGSTTELYIQHSTVAPSPLREHVPTISPAVEQVVMRALAKKPQDRFANIRDFAEALERASLGQTVPISPLPATVTQPQEEPIVFEQLWAEVIQAQARGDSQRTFRLLLKIWWMENLTLSQRELVEEEIRSLPEMIAWSIQLARKASTRGDWQVEIRLWETLLAVGSLQQEITEQLTLSERGYMGNAIGERLRVAQQNKQYAWMYTQAQQFIDKQDNAAAHKQLEALWRQAPFYGDPAGLAHKVGLSPANNYEQALAKELAHQQRQREEDERTRQREEDERKATRRKLERDEKRWGIVAEILAGIGVGGLAGVGLILFLPIGKDLVSQGTPAQITIGHLALGLEKVLAIFVNFPEWISGILVGALVGLMIGAVVGYIKSTLHSASSFNGVITGRIVGCLAGAIILGAIGGIFGYLGAAIGSLIGAAIGVWIIAWIGNL